MVKVVPWGKAKRRIGVLSISVDQLIGIIESRKVKRVTASKVFWKRTVEFTSIEDIKENKAQVVGNTSFYLDGINLEFSTGIANLSVWLNDKEVSGDLLASLHSELIAHKSSLDKVFDFVSRMSVPAFLAICGASVFKSQLMNAIHLNEGQAFYVVFLPLFAITLLNSYRALFRKGVTYTPVPGFWAVHGSNIIAGLIGTAILGWVGFIGKILTTAPKP